MQSLSTRMKAILHYENVLKSIRRVACIYGVSKSTVARWVQDGLGNLEVVKHQRLSKPRKLKVPELQAKVAIALEANPFMSGSALASYVREETGQNISESTTSRARTAAGFRQKVARRSQQHQSVDVNHPFITADGVYDGAIAVDESSFLSIDTPRKGWAHRPNATGTCRSRRQKYESVSACFSPLTRTVLWTSKFVLDRSIPQAIRAFCVVYHVDGESLRTMSHFTSRNSPGMSHRREIRPSYSHFRIVLGSILSNSHSR
jgi:transposase